MIIGYLSVSYYNGFVKKVIGVLFFGMLFFV